MATVGVDCHVILDGTGYLLAPHSYQMHRPRIRKSTLTLINTERWVDLGPGKRIWLFTVLAMSDLTTYGGGPLGMSAQQIRAALEASFAQVATTVLFTDPLGVQYTVRFDGLTEVMRDARSQVLSPGFLMGVELVEF